MGNKCEDKNNLTPNIFPDSEPVYFYELPSSIGSSPPPCHWTKMLSLYGDKFGDCNHASC